MSTIRDPKLKSVNMAGNNVDDRLLTVSELSDYLGLATGTIYNKVYRGEIPHLKVGRSVRFRRSVIDTWIDEQTATEEAA